MRAGKVLVTNTYFSKNNVKVNIIFISRSFSGYIFFISETGDFLINFRLIKIQSHVILADLILAVICCL